MRRSSVAYGHQTFGEYGFCRRRGEIEMGYTCWAYQNQNNEPPCTTIGLEFQCRGCARHKDAAVRADNKTILDEIAALPDSEKQRLGLATAEPKNV